MPCPASTNRTFLGVAALASSDGGQDPVDGAIRAAAAKKAASDLPKLSQVRSVRSCHKNVGGDGRWMPSGATVRAVKGAFAAVAGLTQSTPDASTTANELEAQGFRVLAVAVGPPDGAEDLQESLLSAIRLGRIPPRSLRSCTRWECAP